MSKKACITYYLRYIGEDEPGEYSYGDIVEKEQTSWVDDSETKNDIINYYSKLDYGPDWQWGGVQNVVFEEPEPVKEEPEEENETEETVKEEPEEDDTDYENQTEKIIAEQAAMLESIQSQYEEKMKQIEEIKKQIEEIKKQLDYAISNGLNSTVERLNNKLQTYTEKLNEYMKAAEEWLETQKKAAEDFLNSQIDAIKKRAENEIKKLAEQIIKKAIERKNSKKTV